MASNEKAVGYQLRVANQNFNPWELSKQKIKLTLTQQEEWIPYFEEQRSKAASLLNTVATDKETNMMVHQLYGLTVGEIWCRQGISPGLREPMSLQPAAPNDLIILVNESLLRSSATELEEAFVKSLSK